MIISWLLSKVKDEEVMKKKDMFFYILLIVAIIFLLMDIYSNLMGTAICKAYNEYVRQWANQQVPNPFFTGKA